MCYVSIYILYFMCSCVYTPCIYIYTYRNLDQRISGNNYMQLDESMKMKLTNALSVLLFIIDCKSLLIPVVNCKSNNRSSNSSSNYNNKTNIIKLKSLLTNYLDNSVNKV